MGRRTFGIAVLAAVAAGLWPASALAACPTFASSNQVMGHVADTSLNELSDLVASTDNPGVFWTEEDSSNPNNVYAINGTGQIVGVFTIQGTKDYDWEDLSIDRRSGTDFLFVGDIGDNKGTRNGGTGAKSFPRLYRFPEPTVSASGPKVTATITAFDTFVYRYADANGTFIAPRNAESLMTDPITHDVYIVEKKVQTIGNVKQNWVFRFDQPLQNGVTNVARKVAITTTAKSYVSADISPTGDIALKAGTTAYIWPRAGAATVEATFAAHPAAPCTASPLIASEAIGWAPDGLWMVPDGVVPAPVVRLAFAP